MVVALDVTEGCAGISSSAPEDFSCCLWKPESKTPRREVRIRNREECHIQPIRNKEKGKNRY
jgi:hypothetical protein